jgi:hypothetical protein
LSVDQRRSVMRIMRRFFNLCLIISMRPSSRNFKRQRLLRSKNIKKESNFLERSQRRLKRHQPQPKKHFNVKKNLYYESNLYSK